MHAHVKPPRKWRFHPISSIFLSFACNTEILGKPKDSPGVDDLKKIYDQQNHAVFISPAVAVVAAVRRRLGVKRLI